MNNERRKTKRKKILENSAEKSAKEFLYESKVSQAIKEQKLKLLRKEVGSEVNFE